MADTPPSQLSPAQKEVWLRLSDMTYTKDKKPSQAVVTQIFKKLFNDSPDEVFINNLQYIFAYQKLTAKNEKDLDTIKEDLVKKIPGRISKLRLRNILNENRMDMLREEVNDLEAKNLEYVNTQDDKKDAPAPAPAPAPVAAPAQAPPAGMTAEDYAVMQQMADMRAGNRAEEKNMEDERGNMTLSSILSRYIDTNSQYYKDNKKEINDILKIFANPKNIDDGSWLTKLADKEFPGVEIFQGIIKSVGLGFSKEDDEDLMKLLDKDPTAAKELSDGRVMDLLLKMMINPDKIGTLVSTRISQAGDDIAKWWKKVKNEKADLPKDDQAIADKIDERRKANEKSKTRDKTIDEWMGVPPEEKSKDGLPQDAGTGNELVVDGGEYDPSNLSYEDAYNIMMPPGLEKYGYEDTSAGQDFARWAWGFITAGAYRNTGRKEFLESLAKEHPEQYAEYQERLSKYMKVVGKAGQERDKNIDYEVSKDYIDSAKKLTEDLIKKAIADGKIDRASAEKLYDGWDIMNGISDGTAKMSYADFETLQSKIFNALPREVLTANSDAINEFMTNNADAISANWDGDSELGNFDWLKDILDPTRTKDDKEGSSDPREKQIGRWKPTADQAEVKYRYRGRWGDTDKLFEKMADDVEKRNLVIEVQRLRESVDTTNKLVQSQLMTDKMRFDNTFKMPPPQPSTYYPLPDKFKREHRAIFTPAVIQNPMRDFERNTRDEAYFGQYQGFSPAVMPTSARQDLLTNPLVYTSNADLATGGELQEVGKPTLFDLIKERRF